MQVVCFAGYSGSGKTTLIEQLIPVLIARGQRVSVIKHAHHHFDVDQEGKDSWRHRKAGAYEVLLASDQRMALMREYAQATEVSVHDMLAQLDSSVDWVLIEGFKHGDVPKIEVWRQQQDRLDKGKTLEPLFSHDAMVLAVATDAPGQLPGSPAQPVLDLRQPQAVLQWLLAHAETLEYKN